MSFAEKAKPWVGLISAVLPVIEQRFVNLLPVNPRIREDAMAPAIFFTLLAAGAGVLTAASRRTGLIVGWVFLLAAFAVLAVFFSFIESIPSGERTLYVLFFLFAGASIGAFLAAAQQP